MSKRNETTEIQRVVPPAGLMQAAKQDAANADLREYRVVPRVTVVQALSRELRKTFEEGDVVLLPGSIKLTEPEGDGFQFVPLFFFPEWITWKDRNDKDPNTMSIIDRSLDKTSVIARKAADTKLRYEGYGPIGKDGNPSYRMRHAEHLNFIGLIYAGDLKGTLVSLSFSRGEYRTGREFINKIIMRKQEGVEIPLWGQVWLVKAAQHSNDQHSWGGIDLMDAPNPFISDEDVPTHQAFHEELKRLHLAKRLIVEREGEDAAEVGEVTEM